MPKYKIRTLASFFYSIYRYLKEHRTVFHITVPLLFVLLAYWASRIRFEEDITKLIPTSEGSATISAVLRSANFADKTVINIAASDTGDIAALKAYADSFATAIGHAAAPYIERLQVRLEDDQLTDLMAVVANNLPLFLDESDYQRIDSLLRPDSVAAIVDRTYQAITAPQSFVTAPMLRRDPLGLTFLGLRKLQRLQSGEGIALDDGYLIADGGNHLLAFITTTAGASETARNTEFIRILDETIARLNTTFAGRATAEYFGATAMAVANAQQIKQDIRNTLSIALIALVALFIYFYRRATIPLIIILPAAFGSLLGMVVLYWLKGTISAISIGIGSVLLGLTLDYSLHILTHYRGTGDVKRLFESTTKPLLMCAIFTAVDFLCLLFLHSDVLKDLGIFAAVSVLGAALFSLVFIPQVYSPRHEVTLRQNTFIDAIAQYDFSRNKWILGIGALLTLVSLFTFQRVGFNDDLAALNYQPESLKRAEQRLDSLTQYAAKSIYLVAYGSTPEEVLARNADLFRQLEQLEDDGAILGFQSVGGMAAAPDQQQEKIERWNRFWSPGKKAHLRQQLLSEGARAGFNDNLFQPFFETLERPFEPLDEADRQLLDTLFLAEFMSHGPQLTTVTTVVKVTDERAPQLTQSFTDEQRGILAIDRKHVQETLLGNLEADFNTLFFIASIAVFVVTFLFFGSLELTLVTNIPIFLGWLVTLGLMGLLGVDFNAFNIIITTLIFGLGVDYSIFVTKGLLEQYTYGRADMPAYKSGVVMSALATILCFGILVFAKHPAIRSISIIPLIGLLVVVLMSFSIQPYLFRLFISGPQANGNTPWRLVNFVLTCFTFGYFFLGGMAVSILGRLLIPIVPLSKKKKFRAFHRVLQLFFHNLMYRTPGIRMEVIGRDDATHRSPAIIIANHTSILDTPTMGLLHSRQVFMMNDRQLNSPFFGRAMRMVGAHPASGNQPEDIEKLRTKIDQGYSVIVFPEGTRSRTTAIQRFHKGAFYLAEQLQVDIQPVLIHGNAHSLPKNDNMLKPGPITMQFLPRIKPSDTAFGTGYAERTKKISAYFRQEFRALRNERESADYFRKKLLLNYVYKPKAIQREVKAVFHQCKDSYHRLLRLLPLKGTFLHLGCGYGVLDFLLVYDSALRQVTGWDRDAERVAAAQHTFTVNRYALRFVADMPAFARYDVLIVSPGANIDWQAVQHLPTWVVLEDAPADAPALLGTRGYALKLEAAGCAVYWKSGGGE
ncbi:1-acyl-sn-glycerol-3-phosphate acyltransferase [Parapedobacter sp. 10938]|uniref:1-acyl-sn-glycerol-3-phosphate acyltransferase n=1 Tax=Parapedobacter flavus TaxID=3110225 RepID=UPI002DB990C4|nr:1-acyl-sn-glycerol-3-phosphate acyltransferase [Parapedobacter sp. 10938]MEC3879339.1 1-acyl-sn-glycerol-3-phosphate acyltransferase [Parapedobacter sp. 10938]